MYPENSVMSEGENGSGIGVGYMFSLFSSFIITIFIRRIQE
jgi:hypothetical protein